MLTTDFAAGFIVFQLDPNAKREYLVMKHAAGHWEFAKGHVHGDETWLDTAKRELTEETGIVRIETIPDFARKIQYIYRHPKRGVIYKSDVFFLGRTYSPKILISDEHLDFKFLNFELALKRLTHVSTRALLRDAEEFLMHYNC